MQGRGRFDNRQQELASISRSLKGLAKELSVPIVALSQLSRAPEARSDHRPQLSDLRESGALEQDADVVMMIFRPGVYEQGQTPDLQNIAEIIIAKQRNGPIGTVNLAFLHAVHAVREHRAGHGVIPRPTVGPRRSRRPHRTTTAPSPLRRRLPRSTHAPASAAAGHAARRHRAWSRPTPTATAPRASALALEAAGAPMLACADIAEGVLLRSAGVRAPILVFGALSIGDLDGVVDYDLTPTVSTPAAATRSNWRPRAAASASPATSRSTPA